MPVAYKNTRTGRVVELDAPDALMDRSKTWQRVEDDDQPDQVDDDTGDDTGEEPKPADVRAWAKEAGVDVPARGKLPAEVVDAYKAAHAE